MSVQLSLRLCLLGILGFHLSHAFIPSQLPGTTRTTSGAYQATVLPQKSRETRISNHLSTAVFEGSDVAVSSDTNERGLALLKDAIAFNSPAAAELVSELNLMRGNGTPREVIDEFLDYLLSSGPDTGLPLWTRSKRLARFSRRARMASLRRTLDLTTPPPSESSTEKEDSLKSQQQRRRRALTSLVRTLSDEESNEPKVPAIVVIEKKARQAMLADAADLRSRLPEGLETPKYDILASRGTSQGSVEIRRYEPYSVCAVSMSKPRPGDASKTDATLQMPEMGGASSFGALAGYLFGKNDKSTAMKMTTPVFTAPGSEAEEKQMQFVLPSEYWNDEKAAPQPLSGSGVTLQRTGAEERAVIMFGGYASKNEVNKRKKELTAALAKDREWKASKEDIAVAQYNDPFTVPWRRLNEVSVPVTLK
jgi:hypothetical protein